MQHCQNKKDSLIKFRGLWDDRNISVIDDIRCIACYNDNIIMVMVYNRKTKGDIKGVKKKKELTWIGFLGL